MKPPHNENTVYFATVNDNGQVNLKSNNTDKSERKRLKAEKRKFSIGGASYERRTTQPGRYM